jgi:glycine/D-amino acid oxidase-like deaminating enzyme
MKDVLIVGFGLAGLSIAKHAEDKGLSFDIISDNSQKSSRIAGGILNPIAVKRMKPVWNVEKFLPFANDFYKTLEFKYKQSFIFKQMLKVAIHSTEQENNWYESYDKPRVNPHILKQLETNHNKHINFNKVGTVSAALVNLKSLFTCALEYYSNQCNWVKESFNHSALNISDEKIYYYKKEYRHVIFCEGFGVTNNPFFNDLGIYGNKGDYIILESKDLNYNNILKSRYFLIPLGKDLYKFGATYQRKPLNHQPSEDARRQMTEALDRMINVPYKIVDQVCGIRPTTKDRKPILGTHRNHKNLHLLNGFGSRGVMTSPLLGHLLIEHIFENGPIENEVSIDRIYAQTSAYS